MMRLIVGLASLVVIVAGLRATSALLIPFVLALFLTVITFPLVRWMQGRGAPPLLAVLATVLVVLAALIGPGALIVRTVQQFASAVPEIEAGVRKSIAAVSAWLGSRGLDDGLLLGLADPPRIFALVLSTLGGVVTALSFIFLVVLISAFMLIETCDVMNRRAGVMPPAYREAVARVARQMQVWLWVKTIISLGTGVAAGLLTALIGLEFALLWGLIAFLLNYIPNFGSLVAAIPPALLALIQGGPLAMVLVIVGYVAINLVFGSVLEPYLMGRRIGISPLAVLLAVIFWGWMWGIAGMLLAVPITVAMIFALQNSDELRWIADLATGTTRSEPTGDAAPADRPLETLPGVRPGGLAPGSDPRV